MNIKKIFFVLMILIGISDTINAQKDRWIAPEYSNNYVNPFKNKESATLEGKKIFNQMCVLCHGLQGKGNGEAGLSLEKKPANFLALNVVKETDGAIFWKITQGKPPMASYEGLLSDVQRWQLVNYIRQLEKKK